MILSSSNTRQRGFNLIEIMVAMTIGLVLILGTTTLYMRSKQTADQDDSLARLQETARYALNVMETDLRMANYWGLDKDGNGLENSNFVPANFPTKCTGNPGYCAEDRATSAAAAYCGAAFVTDLPHYIEGTNNQFYAALPCPANQVLISPSADSITVRRASPLVAPAPTATTVQTCTNASGKFTVTRNAACPGGELHNLVMSLYYVNNQSDGGTTVPSLRRVRLVDGPATQDEEVVSGVEDLQVEFGWDSNDSSSFQRARPLRYVQPNDPILNNPDGTPNGRIVSVRVWLLIRSDTTEPGFTDTQTYQYADRTGGVTAKLDNAAARGMQYQPNDGFHRLLVSKTIFLRNATGT